MSNNFEESNIISTIAGYPVSCVCVTRTAWSLLEFRYWEKGAASADSWSRSLAQGGKASLLNVPGWASRLILACLGGLGPDLCPELQFRPPFNP